MRVKMKTLMAGPKGVRHPGSIHDLDKAEAYGLIEGGYADQVDEAIEKETAPADEAAVAAGGERAIAPARETATGGQPGRKK